MLQRVKKKKEKKKTIKKQQSTHFFHLSLSLYPKSLTELEWV